MKEIEVDLQEVQQHLLEQIASLSVQLAVERAAKNALIQQLEGTSDSGEP